MSSSGLTRRTSSSGTSANSTDTSSPTASPCATADSVRPYDTPPNDAASDAGIARMPAPASATPIRLPASPSSTTCNTYVASTCAVDAPTHLRIATLRIFCLHEHAGDAPDADPAEHDDDEADQAEEVLGALQVLADLIFGRTVRARVDEAIAEPAANVARRATRRRPPAP